MADWGGFVRTKMSGGGNTVVAREVLQEDNSNAVLQAQEKQAVKADTKTQPTIGMLIPENVNKRAYLEYVRDFLVTQLSIVENEIQNMIS